LLPILFTSWRHKKIQVVAKSVLANASFFAKMGAVQFAEEQPMSNPSYRQSDVVKDFLRVSRRYFDLAPDRPDLPRLKRAGRVVLQSLLIAGGLGGTLGSVAHADYPADETPEVRTERGVLGSEQLTNDTGKR
jgi:hypothetical protein